MTSDNDRKNVNDSRPLIGATGPTSGPRHEQNGRRANAVFKTLAWLVTGFVAGLGAYEMLLRITNQVTIVEGELQRQVDLKVTEELDTWNFTEPLYRALPSDIDFLARNATIDFQGGTGFTIKGPMDKDFFRLRVSQVKQTGETTWSANFAVDAIAHGNIVSGVTGVIPILKGQLVGPIDAGTHSFYVFVEEISVGGQATVAIGRRRSATEQINVHGSVFFGGPLLLGPAIPIPDSIISD